MASVQIKIPNWLDRILAWPVMRYRRRKYGYPYRRIYLGEGKWTLMDAEDYYRFGNFKWVIGGYGSKLYAVRVALTGGKIKTLRLNREITNAPKGLVVDHQNGDSLDNRRANLRIATHTENMQNRGKVNIRTSSRFIGVHFDKRKKRWAVWIGYQRKRLWLGRFDDEIAAARAYDAAARKYHGEFARLNFPD